MTEQDAPAGYRNQWQPGAEAWFEYHCWESEDSNDADLWHRSHQKVTVVAEYECDGQREYLPTFEDRCEAGMPLTYGVRWSDGHQGAVWEDELLTGPEHYYRPDPPKRSDD